MDCPSTWADLYDDLDSVSVFSTVAAQSSSPQVSQKTRFNEILGGRRKGIVVPGMQQVVDDINFGMLVDREEYTQRVLSLVMGLIQEHAGGIGAVAHDYVDSKGRGCFSLPVTMGRVPLLVYIPEREYHTHSLPTVPASVRDYDPTASFIVMIPLQLPALLLEMVTAWYLVSITGGALLVAEPPPPDLRPQNLGPDTPLNPAGSSVSDSPFPMDRKEIVKVYRIMSGVCMEGLRTGIPLEEMTPQMEQRCRRATRMAGASLLNMISLVARGMCETLENFKKRDEPSRFAFVYVPSLDHLTKHQANVGFMPLSLLPPRYQGIHDQAVASGREVLLLQLSLNTRAPSWQQSMAGLIAYDGLYYVCDRPECGKGEVRVGEWLVCSRCKLARYCSKDCQRAHWKAHKVAWCSIERDAAELEDRKPSVDAPEK